MGIVAGLGLKTANPIAGWIFVVGSVLVFVAGCIDLFVGFSVREMRAFLESRILIWFLKREAAATGLILEESHHTLEQEELLPQNVDLAAKQK